MVSDRDPQSVSRRRGTEGRWLLVILLVGLALRVLFLLQAGEHLFFNEFSDSLYYQRWAQRIVQGLPHPPVFYMGPIYPYLLALFHWIFGPDTRAILWFQVILGVGSCGLLYLLGRQVFGSAVGLLAAAMGALYLPEIFYEGAMLMTTLLFFLNLCVLICVHWALERRGWFLWILPGLLLGLSALGRANVLSALPLFLAGIFLIAGRARGGPISRIPAALALLAGLLLVLTPAAAHNTIVGHDTVLVTSNLGLNFFIGNNPDARGYYDQPKGLDLSNDLYGAKIASVFSGEELRPSQVSRFWLARGLSFVRENPGRFLRLTLDKFLFYWNAYEIPQVEHLDFFKRFAPLLRWPLLNFSLLGPLGILGVIVSLRFWKRVYFLLAWILSLMTATVIFFVIARLRLQICPALMIFAAYGLIWLWDRLRSRKAGQIGLAVLILVPLVLLVNLPHPALSRSRDLAKSHNFLALYLWKNGHLEQAAREYQRAIAADPDLPESFVQLANLRFEQGHGDETLRLYEKALDVDPRASAVHINRGTFYANDGLWEDAIREYQAEIRVSPYSIGAYQALADALKKRAGEGRSTADSSGPR